MQSGDKMIGKGLMLSIRDIPEFPVNEILKAIEADVSDAGFGISKSEFIVVIKLLVYGRMTASNIARLKVGDISIDEGMVIVYKGKKEKEISIPSLFIKEDIDKVSRGYKKSKIRLLPHFFKSNAYYLMKKFFSTPSMKKSFPKSTHSFIILRHAFLVELSNKDISLDLPMFMYKKLSNLERVKIFDVFSALNQKTEEEIISLAASVGEVSYVE
jgi:integrase